MPGDENDWNADLGCDEYLLNIEPAQPWQPHVQDQATNLIRRFSRQKLRRRAKGLASQTDGFKQRHQSITNVGSSSTT
jgi:hypothetical protein